MQNVRAHPAFAPSVFFLIGAFCLATQIGLGIRLRALDSAPVVVSKEDKANAWSPELFRAISFGHWPAGIDWMWIQALTDDSLQHVPRGAHPAFFYDLRFMTDLDPAFFDLYYAGAHLLAVIRGDGLGAQELLLKGERFLHEGLEQMPESFRRKYWPFPWQLPLVHAYVELFELDDMPAASERFEQASRMAGAPAYLKLLIEQLHRPGGQYEVGLRLLNFLISGATDARVVRSLEERRDSLQVSYYLFGINRDFREFLSHRPRSSSMPSLWQEFRRSKGLSERDPFGGELSVNPDGKIVTTAPHARVFGLE